MGRTREGQQVLTRDAMPREPRLHVNVARACIAALCALWWLATPAAHAQASVPQHALQTAISVEPGASCLQQPRLVDHIATWLGRTQIRADVRVVVRGDASDPRRISFDLIQDARSRTRVFDSSPEICGDMHAVVGLAIALAIDAEAMNHVTPTMGEPTAPRRMLLTVQASLAYEVLPELSLGGQIGTEVELLSWLSLRIDAFVQHSRRDTLAGSNGTFDATLFAGAIAACTGGRVDPHLRLSLCSGLAGGGIYGQGDGFAPNRSDTGPWLSVRSGVRFEIMLGVPWLLDLDVVSALVSPTFESGPEGAAARVRTPSSTALEVSLGPAIVF